MTVAVRPGKISEIEPFFPPAAIVQLITLQAHSGGQYEADLVVLSLPYGDVRYAQPKDDGLQSLQPAVSGEDTVVR